MILRKVRFPFLLSFFITSMIWANKDSVEEKDLRTRIDTYMERVESSGFSGAILVGKEGKIIISKGFGLAHREKNIPVTENTVFTTGSITKQFTGAAILKLQMMGKIRVTDLITKYFKDVPDDKKEITLHHLLTHTAGFPGGIGHDFDPITRDDFIALAMKTPLNRKSGVEYEYSNVGFSLLGAIVEIVSKQSYEQFLNQHLFKPAGMKKTGYLIPNWAEEELAHGYRGDQHWGTLKDHPWAEDGPGWHLRANGGILSTTGDMYKWHMALLGETVLSKEAKSAYYRPHVPEGRGADTHYGYGWSIVTTPRNTRLITHNGGNPYFSADFLRYVDEDVVIFTAANTAENRAFKIAGTLARIIFDEDYSPPPANLAKMDAEALEKSTMGQRALAVIGILGRTEDNVEAFMKTHFAPDVIERRSDAIIGFLKQDEGELGRVEFGEAMQSEAFGLEIKVLSKASGEWWLLGLGFEKEAPHRITSITVDSTGPLLKKDETGLEIAYEHWGLPDSITGRRSGALLEVLKKGDEAVTTQFLNQMFAPDFLKSMSLEEHLGQFKKMTEALNDFELLGAMKTGPYSARLKVSPRDSEEIYVMEFELESQESNRFTGLQFKQE